MQPISLCRFVPQRAKTSGPCVHSLWSVQKCVIRATACKDVWLVHAFFVVNAVSVSIRATACKDVWPVLAFFVVSAKVCQFTPQHAKTSVPCLRSFSVFSCSVCASLCAVGVGGQ